LPSAQAVALVKASTGSLAAHDPSERTPLLEIAHVSLGFSGVTALSDVSLAVADGELVAIIGPNGAGKTSLFNCISGAYRPTGGEVRFAGRSLAGLPPHHIAALGVGRMFQNLALFDHLSTIDNLLLGRH